ncbi:siderophore-interacting protein [Streptomyces sp. MS2A]|nr:siderophore-interacting protein [Streptomyces sp. MS2A]
MALREFVTHPLVLRRLEVIGVRDITPRMRRVTFGGPEVRAFERDGLSHGPFHSPGFDDHVKIILAEDGDTERVLPTQLAAGIEWIPAPERRARDYTPRRVTEDEIDLDFVLHGAGPAVAWARAARPGDPLWIVGPKSSIVLPEALDWIALIGDETALPAIGRFLDERPVEAPAHVVVTIGAASARQDLDLRPGDTIRWVLADPTDRDVLEAAVRESLPAKGDGFVWAGAESRTLLPIRRLLTREHELAKNRMNLTGYWHAEPEDDAPAPPEIPSPLAWFVVRAALRSGILDELADRPGPTVEELAGRRGLAPAAVSALLPTLVHHGLVAVSEEHVRLDAAGESLLADEHEREEYDGHEADLLLALAELAPALRGEDSPWQRSSGRTLAEQAAADAGTRAELAHGAEVLRFVGGALLRDPLWQQARRVLLAGPGADEWADLARESGTDADFLRAEDGDDVGNSGLLPDDSRPVDLVLGVLALGHRTDAEARVLLERLDGRADTVVLVESARADSLSPVAHEAPVLALAANGSGLRDAAALAALAADLGWSTARTIPLGWGVDAVVLRMR